MQPTLIQAYFQAKYLTFLPGRVVEIRIHHAAEALSTYCQMWQRAAILTACNPRSQQLSPEENSCRMERLLQILQPRYPCSPARSEDDHGEWQEPSVLIWGMHLEEARAVGRIFGQNAFVFLDASAHPLLIACEPEFQPLIDACEHTDVPAAISRSTSRSRF
ncbi:MAG: hypothetical protein KatS3mg113_0754 [Planctomycetaceae bacterium]|nr:MAG: hypothetical protein KatS3mg113_0754 [Planctomycetaceae bacterium]